MENELPNPELEHKTWLVADTHLGHYNIIKYSNRPFSSIEEMDRVLLDNINKHVKQGDKLFHLGDFSMRGKKLDYYRNRIVCRDIKLIVGNHDPRYKDGQPKEMLRQYFSGIYTTYNLHVRINGVKQLIFLSHYAHRVWDRSHHGTMCAYGHSHYSLPDDPNSLSMDVGVDSVARKLSKNGELNPIDYRPISVEEFAKWMSKKTFKPIDHHGR